MAFSSGQCEVCDATSWRKRECGHSPAARGRSKNTAHHARHMQPDWQSNGILQPWWGPLSVSSSGCLSMCKLPASTLTAAGPAGGRLFPSIPQDSTMPGSKGIQLWKISLKQTFLEKRFYSFLQLILFFPRKYWYMRHSQPKYNPTHCIPDSSVTWGYT